MGFDDAMSEFQQRRARAEQKTDVGESLASEIRAAAAEIINDFIHACRERGIAPTPVTYLTWVPNWRGRKKEVRETAGHGWYVVKGIVILDTGQPCRPQSVAPPAPFDFGSWVQPGGHPGHDPLASHARWIGKGDYGQPAGAGHFKSTYPHHRWIPTVPLDFAEFSRDAPLVVVLAYFVATGGRAAQNQLDIYE